MPGLIYDLSRSLLSLHVKLCRPRMYARLADLQPYWDVFRSGGFVAAFTDLKEVNTAQSEDKTRSNSDRRLHTDYSDHEKPLLGSAIVQTCAISSSIKQGNQVYT
jgi:hypothetical protein